MRFGITNIAKSGVDTATVSLQEEREDNPDGAATPTPMPVSSMQLVVPLVEGQKYSIGDTYELDLKPVARGAARRGGAQ